MVIYLRSLARKTKTAHTESSLEYSIQFNSCGFLNATIAKKGIAFLKGFGVCSVPGDH